MSYPTRRCPTNPWGGRDPAIEHDCPGYGYEWDESHGVCIPSSSRLPLGFQSAKAARCLNTNHSCPECVACPREGHCLIPDANSPCCQATLGVADDAPMTSTMSFWTWNGRSVGV